MTINPDYGDATATAPPWADIEQRLTDSQLYWMVTARRDGRPHAVPVCGLWREGAFWFCTGDGEQKMRNLEHDAHVSVLAGTLGADGWAAGKDISVEGEAVKVVDDDLLRTLAAGWLEKYGEDWRYDVRDGRFYEASRSGAGGDGGAAVFRVAPAKVLVFGDEHGQTRYIP